MFQFERFNNGMKLDDENVKNTKKKANFSPSEGIIFRFLSKRFGQ